MEMLAARLAKLADAFTDRAPELLQSAL